MKLKYDRLYKVNLHSHTLYSDGGDNIEDMAIMARNLGHCCYIITDHYYGKGVVLSSYSLTVQSFQKQIQEAKEVSERLNFPIIVGIECVFDRCEEINVFGYNAIMYLLTTGTSVEDYKIARERYNCAMILNHPCLDISLEKGVHKVIDGFERFNCGQDCFEGENPSYEGEGHRCIPEELRALKYYSNSDAHQAETLDRGYNLFYEEIKTEDHLIRYLKNERPVSLGVFGNIYHCR